VGSYTQRSRPDSGSSAIARLNGEHSTRFPPARIGVDWNLARRATAPRRSSSPLC
jgi:hypothetical protein